MAHTGRGWAVVAALALGCGGGSTDPPPVDGAVAAWDDVQTVPDTATPPADTGTAPLDTGIILPDRPAPAMDVAQPAPDRPAPAMDVPAPPTDTGPARTDATAPADAGTPQEDCTRYPFSNATLLAERVGYGRAATGGDPRRIYRVTTLSGDSTGSGSSGSLRRALESDEPWTIVFDVSGTITHRTRVNVRANKTVDGRGRDIHLRGELRLANVRNVILSDIRLSNDLEGHCTQAGDVLNLTGSGTTDPAAFTTRDIWLHHVEVFNGGDGLVDIRGGSRVTISWSHFHTHKKGMLFQRDSADRETPGMRVTMHHNWFDRLSYRGPQLLHGRMHYFNNFQYQWMYYGVGSLGGAQLLSEANV
jgi:hypothetical protein